MFETSNDILNIVLAVCIIALTFFLCWGIYYFIEVVHRWHKITRKVEKSVNEVEEIVSTVKSKLHGSAAYLLTLGDTASRIFDYIKSKNIAKDKEENVVKKTVKRKATKTTKKKK